MFLSHKSHFRTSLTVLATALALAGCGGGDSGDDSTASNNPPPDQTSPPPSTTPTTEKGVVTGAAFVPGSATDPNIKAAYFANAMVCVDANNNGKCDTGENAVRTDAKGAFTLQVASVGPLLADIGTDATNTGAGAAVTSRMALRISADQIKDQGVGSIVISPMSSEIQRMVEDNSTDYATEKANLATRIGVQATDVTGDANAAAGATMVALLNETQQLSNRYTYATTKLDRGDLYPDALAVAGGDPELTTQAGVSSATANTPETRKPITFTQAQQAAFNVEGIPRYDAIFIVMLENKGTQSIKASPFAPNINHYLQTGNQFTSYFATGNPSEPNYTALGGGDDFGITDDSQWNCAATGANAPQDLPLPTNTQPGLASSPFNGTCAGTVNHNIVNSPNLFTSISAAGMTWRTYSESMNPGQDFRTDSVSDNAVKVADNVYPISAPTGAIGNAALQLTLPGGLYKTKHHPGMAYQSVRSAPEFKFSNRTLGGGQWDSVLLSSTKYTVPSNYDLDQFGTDLTQGTFGNLNFVVPDQCDDMHGITVSGATAGGTAGTASDCGGSAIIMRGDIYVDKVVKKIEASPAWMNRQKKIAIVLMFDEGGATSGFNSCCGWNVSNSTVANPLKQNADGTFSVDTSVANYTNGNRGHGNSIYGVLTNQPDAPKGVADSDVYSHFSFVRTLQDMFQLADPAKDGSYMNRSKYTEKFIAQNILNLPEFANSGDTHFDGVRPMNHAYVIPAGYLQKQSSDVATPPQTGPDGNQMNMWAIKK